MIITILITLSRTNKPMEIFEQSILITLYIMDNNIN